MKARSGIINNTAISAYAQSCDGYGMPGATGLGYVSVLKVITGAVEANAPNTTPQYDFLLNGIVAYDRAEAWGAYIGQINMGTASSFCGLAGQVWGYDIAIADQIQNGSMTPLFYTRQYDNSVLPVYDAGPLLYCGLALFGSDTNRVFPPAPGAYVVCANKSVTALHPANGVLNPANGDAYGVWAYIAISITKNRNNSADLFIEDAGLWTQNKNEADLVAYLNSHREQVAWSITKCGEDQRVLYSATYMSYAYCMMKAGEVGTALSVAPYITLAQDAVPPGGFDTLNNMNITQWQNAVNAPTDILKDAYPPGNKFLGPHQSNIDPKFRTTGLGYHRKGGSL